MASRQTAIASERWLDEVLLAVSVADIDGVQSDELLLPAGFGDCAIMSVSVRVIAIDVLATTAEFGVLAQITAPDGSGGVLDLVGASKWITVTNGANAIQLEGTIDPDSLTLWRQDERLQLVFGEIDTDATPTADVRYRVKVVRVRPVVGQQARRPIQLVR